MKTQINLCLVVLRGMQDWRDLLEIGQLVAAADPYISVHLVSPVDTMRALSTEQQQRPTLTVALCHPGSFKPRRGPLLMPRAVDKLDQYRRMIACGLPAPRTEIFKLGAIYEEATWSPYLFVKTGVAWGSSKGGGKVLRTATAHLLTAEDLTGEAGKALPLLVVQPFIDTGVHPTKYRVLVLAGSALYAQYTEVIAERPPLASLSDKELLGLVLDTGGADRFYQHKDYPEVVALAERTAKAFAKLPVLGIDIVQSAVDGKLYVLEINGGGNVWHFSSSHWDTPRRKYPHVVEEMKNQLGAWPRAAAALANLARELAA